nr:unnamed protein product [Digitaria exilis]
MPNEGEKSVVDLLPNISDADDAGLDPKAELGRAVAATEVEPDKEPVAQGNIELGLGAEPIGAEPACESAKLCEIPLFDFSEDLKLKLFPDKAF